MKTISELNAKWWYRLTKVIFILIIVIITLTSLLLIYEENYSRQESDYIVFCNYGNKKTFAARKEAQIYIYGTNATVANLPDYQRIAIQEECEITEKEISEKLAAIANKIDNGIPLFTIRHATVTVGNTWSLVKFSIIALLVILSVSEVIRRCFYYIVLGSIRPKKNHESDTLLP